MRARYVSPLVPSLIVLAGAAGCGDNVGPKATSPVHFQVSAARTTVASATTAPGVAPAPVSVTITLPVRDWFVSNGGSLDPNDPARQAQIVNNAKSSVHPSDNAETGEKQ